MDITFKLEALSFFLSMVSG